MDAWSIIFTFSIIAIFYLTKTEPKKSFLEKNAGISKITMSWCFTTYKRCAFLEIQSVCTYEPNFKFLAEP